ncbi:hypothetical protein Clacol_007150 [Clathrus columnatus]|uniref:Major facilitator superfamily (MFS) profile domain-containing protein n=1 Tax=Clathrus columnatus TaxID=1419009 RepID=A0AAV5AID8_9AGAM|nr:hypothetical protein Clacol_007150 [Clathrus columnatus]
MATQKPEPPAGSLWRSGSLNLNVPIIKRFSRSPSITATSDEETEMEQLWRPNALNLNIPVRNYSLDSKDMTPISLFGKDTSGTGTSKWLGENENVDNSTLMSVRQLAIIFGGLMMILSLVAIDQTIIVTALPTIASDFNSISDLSWIASSFYITEAGSILFFGRIITISSVKWTLLVSVFLFELGSLFCAIAHSAGFLIFGRAMSGIGAAGIFIGITSTLPEISTLKQRPILMNCFGAVFAIFSIIGPLFGGIFVDKLTWSFASVTLFLLGLQSGGNTKPWSDGAVIAPLVLGILLFVGFCFWENYRGSRAIAPITLLKRRNVLGACVQQSLNFWGFRTAVYYLPLLYQLRGQSAEKSGLDMLWYMVSGLLTTMVSCGITTATGHIWFLMCLPQILAVVAFGLLSTTKPDTSYARLAGFQILLGVGLGAGINNPILIAQADLADDPEAAALATTLVVFSEFMASGINSANTPTIMTLESTNGAIFSGALHSQISKLAGDLPPHLRTEALESVMFVLTLPDNFKGRVIEAYINAIGRVFFADIVPTAVSMLTAFIIERKKISVQ